MNCHYELKGFGLIIHVPTELDHHVAKSIQEDVDAMIETYGVRTVIFDFAQTEFMDSSGIGVILGRSRNLNFSGGKVKAKNLNSPRIQKIFQMSGLDQVISVENEGRENACWKQ